MWLCRDDPRYAVLGAAWCRARITYRCDPHLVISRNRSRALLVLFGGDLTILLVARLANASVIAEVTQWLLMPLLAGYLATASSRGDADRPRSRLVSLVLIGLGFSWLGDLVPNFVPSAQFSLLTLIGLFAVAQACYAAAFWPGRNRSLARTPWLIRYLAFAIALVLLCRSGAGPLLVPVIGYAALITTMAALATGVDRLAGIGDALFMLSDALIALDVFVAWGHLPGSSFWVMSTYGVAQLLIVLGVLRADRMDWHTDVS